MRGEFLRGTGTNSHTNQGSGAGVGEHQDGTEFPHVQAWGDGYRIDWNVVSNNFASNNIENVDGYITGSNKVTEIRSSIVTQLTNQRLKFSTRPTNTSVLYCIKT